VVPQCAKTRHLVVAWDGIAGIRKMRPKSASSRQGLTGRLSCSGRIHVGFTDASWNPTEPALMQPLRGTVSFSPRILPCLPSPSACWGRGAGGEGGRTARFVGRSRSRSETAQQQDLATLGILVFAAGCILFRPNIGRAVRHARGLLPCDGVRHQLR